MRRPRRPGSSSTPARQPRDHLGPGRVRGLAEALEQPADPGVQRPQVLVVGIGLRPTEQRDGLLVRRRTRPEGEQPGEVGRDLGGEAEEAQFALLDRVYDDGDGTLKRVAKDIRSGEVTDARFSDLRQRLRSHVIAELKVRNPRFLKTTATKV